MNSLMRALNRVFAFIAAVFWLAAVAAALWQVWTFFAMWTWNTISVAMAFQRLLGSVPSFSNDSAQVIFAIVSELSLVLVLGLCALAFSALAKLLE
jgi:hypothetical protein